MFKSNKYLDLNTASSLLNISVKDICILAEETRKFKVYAFVVIAIVDATPKRDHYCDPTSLSDLIEYLVMQTPKTKLRDSKEVISNSIFQVGYKELLGAIKQFNEYKEPRYQLISKVTKNSKMYEMITPSHIHINDLLIRKSEIQKIKNHVSGDKRGAHWQVNRQAIHESAQRIISEPTYDLYRTYRNKRVLNAKRIADIISHQGNIKLSYDTILSHTRNSLKLLTNSKNG